MFSRKSLITTVSLVALVVAVFLLLKSHIKIVRKPLKLKETFDPNVKEVQPSYAEVGMNEEPHAVPQSDKQTSGSSDRLTSKDLLPSEAVETNWASVVQVPKTADQITNYLEAGKFVGITSPNSVLKNASLDLRSQPQIPKTTVSPFLNSSYESLDPKFLRGVDIESTQ